MGNLPLMNGFTAIPIRRTTTSPIVSPENTQFLYTPFAELTHKTSPAARDNAEKVEAMKALNHFYFFRKTCQRRRKTVWHFCGLRSGYFFPVRFVCLITGFHALVYRCNGLEKHPRHQGADLDLRKHLTQMSRKRKAKIAHYSPIQRYIESIVTVHRRLSYKNNYRNDRVNHFREELNVCVPSRTNQTPLSPNRQPV